MLGQERAFKVMEEALSASTADQMELVMMGHDHFLTRYANSQIHQNTAEENSTLYIKAVVGKKVGVSSINNFHPKTIAKAVESAVEFAKLQKDIPDFCGLPEKRECVLAEPAYFPRTADMVAEEKALVVQDMIGRAGDKITLSGAFYTGKSELAVINTNGLKEYFTETRANIAVVATGEDTSGYGSKSARDVDQIDHTQLIDEALLSAKIYPKTISLEPGEYPVILEEYAVADMIMSLGGMAFTSNAVEDGRSFVEKTQGEELFPKCISVYDDAMDPYTFVMPCDYEGTPKRRVEFVKNGVVTGEVTYNHYTAEKAGKKPTGHAMPPNYGLTSNYPLHLFMDAGDETYEEMMKRMGTGLLVKRFHYLTTIHPLKTIFSGMTRDGVFWVENGEIVARVANMRFTQSIIDALKNVKGMSRNRKRIWFREFSLDFPETIVVPRLFIEKFNFTGKTEF